VDVEVTPENEEEQISDAIEHVEEANMENTDEPIVNEKTNDAESEN